MLTGQPVYLRQDKKEKKDKSEKKAEFVAVVLCPCQDNGEGQSEGWPKGLPTWQF